MIQPVPNYLVTEIEAKLEDALQKSAAAYHDIDKLNAKGEVIAYEHILNFIKATEALNHGTFNVN